jgi:uncharacterized damage-inducible protein DinB
MTIERNEPSTMAPEREMLDGWLDYHRATLGWKCEGLSDDQLRERAVPPSSLSLLGLVRHITEVERHWFRNIFDGEDAPALYYTDERPDDDFDDLESAPVSQVLASWRKECVRARELTAGRSLDEVSKRASTRTGESFSLRWILTHMVEEYARHNGHADLIRERIDGSTGD